MAELASKYEVKEFVPDESEAKEIKSMVEKEDKKDENEDEKQEEPEQDVDVNSLLKELKALITGLELNKKTNSTSYMQVEEFEKDNDQNYHIDFISSISNLRCVNYKLKQMTWLDVKLKAGRIIPALATTTAAVAGMQTLEMVKVLKCEKIEEYRNYYLNLALPLIQASEPGAVQKVKINEETEVDLWSRWDIFKKDITLQQLFDHIKDTYKLQVKDVMKGSQTIYLHSIMEIVGKEKQKQETLNTKVIELTDCEDEEYIDLRIACTKPASEDDDEEEVIGEESQIIEGVPPVRVYFKE